MQVPKKHREMCTEYLKSGRFLMVKETFASAEGARLQAGLGTCRLLPPENFQI